MYEYFYCLNMKSIVIYKHLNKINGLGPITPKLMINSLYKFVMNQIGLFFFPKSILEEKKQ